jgi:putative aldouronate transport system permease protein
MLNGRMTWGDRVFLVFDYALIACILVITLYPFVYVVSASISDPLILKRGEIWLWPRGIQFMAYQRVFRDSTIWTSYYNTIWYVTVGTAINVLLTTLTAFPLSRRSFSGRNTVMMFIAFTMFFSGGMVPTYLLVKSLGLMNSRLAVVLPVAISTWNTIIMRTFFEGIPVELEEAAKIDGQNELGILMRIFIPLSKPVLAVMVLFYAVGHWNSWFNAMLYLNDTGKYPLQMILRKILIQFDQNSMMTGVLRDRDMVGQNIRYATIVISTVPILCVYPFLQKYFVKGAMIGAIKG